jgi:hypothetical protein
MDLLERLAAPGGLVPLESDRQEGELDSAVDRDLVDGD